jgi:hypothetical protein
MDPIDMANYTIHRLKDHHRQAFRSAPHVSGAASVKPNHYEPAGTIEAPSSYAAYFQMRDSGTPLEVGDLLEDERGALRICKFVGFEEATWVIPEPRSEMLPYQDGSISDSVPETSAAALE